MFAAHLGDIAMKRLPAFAAAALLTMAIAPVGRTQTVPPGAGEATNETTRPQPGEFGVDESDLLNINSIDLLENLSLEVFQDRDRFAARLNTLYPVATADANPDEIAIVGDKSNEIEVLEVAGISTHLGGDRNFVGEIDGESRIAFDRDGEPARVASFGAYVVSTEEGVSHRLIAYGNNGVQLAETEVYVQPGQPAFVGLVVVYNGDTPLPLIRSLRLEGGELVEGVAFDTPVAID